MSEYLVSCIIPVRSDARVHRITPIVSAFSETEVIIACNGSSSSFLRDITDRFPKCRPVAISRTNRSFARNVGATQAFGEWLWFIDSDVTIEGDFVKLWQLLKHSDAQVVQGGILYEGPPKPISLVSNGSHPLNRPRPHGHFYAEPLYSQRGILESWWI